MVTRDLLIQAMRRARKRDVQILKDAAKRMADAAREESSIVARGALSAGATAYEAAASSVDSFYGNDLVPLADEILASAPEPKQVADLLREIADRLEGGAA